MSIHVDMYSRKKRRENYSCQSFESYMYAHAPLSRSRREGRERVGLRLQPGMMRSLAAACTFSTAAAAARPSAIPQLLRLKLPGSLAEWEDAGFARSADSEDVALAIGGIDIGVGGGKIASWGWRDGPLSREHRNDDRAPPSYFSELQADGFTELLVDGIPTSIDDLGAVEHAEYQSSRADVAMPHPNGATSLYSVCVTTPDMDASLAAFEAAGLKLRRLRKPKDPSSELSKGLSMAFFTLGAPPDRDVVLELIGVPSGADSGTTSTLPGGFPLASHAAIAGLVVRVPSLAPLPELLGKDRLGEERDAVQGKGLRIVALKHEAVGLPLPLAFISNGT